MSNADPIALLFGGMTKLGPGSDVDTLAVLERLGSRGFTTVVDAGCGTGRSTLVLARQLATTIHAVDSHEPFLEQLSELATSAGVSDLIETHSMDMLQIPESFPQIDLLWCEGAAYNIGFANALSSWAPAIVPRGFTVVSELTWLRENAIPERPRKFFAAAYPAMQTDSQNRSCCEQAGFTVLGTHTLPESAWREDYYDILKPRAEKLATHTNPTVREFAYGMLEEIAAFAESDGSYGYVFYILQR